MVVPTLRYRLPLGTQKNRNLPEVTAEATEKLQFGFQ